MPACPSCGAENPPGSRFCNHCGARLSAQCPACGASNVPDAVFCNQCGTRLAPSAASAPVGGAAPSPAAATAERRLVSILFADLVGFTALAEGRGPEETRELLSHYFDLAREIVERYAGNIEKFIGDAVMAVWGAPSAQEDDAERAVRAALDLVGAVGRLGPGIAARAGVLTGEAAVTLGARGQGMVAGDPVNTASRLQAAAAPGTVLVGEATMRAASRAIAFEVVGEQALKGKTVPVPAWRALRVVAERGGRNRAETLEPPFVGRDEELHLLKELFHSTARERRARLVSVMGPAGIGKSRLAWEFSKYVDGVAERVWWHVGRSPAYGEGASFRTLGEMVRRRCGLGETDDEATVRAAVASTVREKVPDEAERRWVEGALLTLLGVGATPTAPAELFGAWRAFFERLADSGTVALVFEDFNNADPGLIDFVDHLLEWSRARPIYVLTLARPDLLERRPDWHAKRNLTAVTLEPLSDAAMRELLAGLAPGLPEPAAEAIVTRADGIPLYAVETVRMLLAEGRLALRDGRSVPTGDLNDLAVPETVTALIASRLDGLLPDERALVHDAAVLGQGFTIAALAAVSGIPEDGPPAPALVRPQGDPDGRGLPLRGAGRVPVRPGAQPRGRLPHPGAGGPEGTASRRGTVLRVARLGRAGGRGREPLPRGPPGRGQGVGGERPGGPREGRPGLGSRTGHGPWVPRAGGRVLRASPRDHRGTLGACPAARAGRGGVAARRPLGPCDCAAARGGRGPALARHPSRRRRRRREAR